MTPRTESPARASAGRAARRAVLAVVAAVVVVAAFLPLGGCAVSLFSKEAPEGVDDARLDLLEKRMDAIEKALPAR